MSGEDSPPYTPPLACHLLACAASNLTQVTPVLRHLFRHLAVPLSQQLHILVAPIQKLLAAGWGGGILAAQGPPISPEGGGGIVIGAARRVATGCHCGGPASSEDFT